MKITLPTFATGTFLLLAAPLFAQNSGTSHPEELNDSIVVAAPPNSAVTITSPAPAASPSADEQIVITPPPLHTTQTAQFVHPALRTPAADPADAGIVTTYPYAENALLEGTIIKARLIGEISTEKTRPGSHFIATLSQSVEHDGRVILPVGATLEGRVTEARGGRRLGGGAALHLEPETVTLPDGTLYRLTARVIDLDSGHKAKVNDEGTIVGGSHAKRTATTFGVTTGTGLVAGAMIGGAPGAAIGAGVGAGVGTVLWLKEDRQQTLPEGTELVFSLNRPMDLTPTAK